MAKEVSKAPYNFIGLDSFILERCSNENEILNHDRFCLDLNTGYIDYEIEAITPLHISRAHIEEEKNKSHENKSNSSLRRSESHLFKNPEGKFAIPGNTIRGMTRFNASILSFASVINNSIKKKDIANQRFFYRTFSSEDKAIREWYNNKVGLDVIKKGEYAYTVLNNVEAGYIQKKGNGYVIMPAVKVGGRSYAPIHEYELRKRNVKGINYMYVEGLTKDDYKNKKMLRKKTTFRSVKDYKPYAAEIRYNTDRNRPIIDADGRYKGYLLNPSYIDGKVHHYLVFGRDKNGAEIIITKEQAELYIDDMKYTHKQNPNGDRAKPNYGYYELPGKNEVKPVFYIKDKDTVIFGFTPYLRLPADGSIYDGIPKTHRLYSGRDFTDSIFGWQNFRSKVSFLDALCVSQKAENVKYKMVLGQPKPSWYKAYIKQEDGNELKSYCSENFEIRGRKFYWLRESADVEAMERSLPAPDKQDNLSKTMYCYKEGTKFAGKVKFENLSDEELGLLLFSLKQGDTEGYFNIGMGKPYGLGKCKIKIKQLVVYDIRERYRSFAGKSERVEDIDKYISSFKNYIKECYKTDDLYKIRSYKEYKLSKHAVKSETARYLKLEEFRNKAELPAIEEVIKEKEGCAAFEHC